MPESVFKLRGRTRAAFLNPDRRKSTGMFMKRAGKLEFVKYGSVFHRNKSGNLIEKARVIGMGTDAFGIAHVRYEVSISRRNIPVSYFDSSRTLALSAFAEAYKNRIPID